MMARDASRLIRRSGAVTGLPSREKSPAMRYEKLSAFNATNSCANGKVSPGVTAVIAKGLANAAAAGEDHRVTARERPAYVLDDVSKRIIEQLQEDGRRPYAAIGKAVGLSEAAVRQRVQRLLDSGVMQIVAVTDPLQVGFSRQAMIGVRATGDTTAIAERLGRIPAVDYVVLTAGSFDILAEVVCENDDDLIELLNQDIRGIPGVQSTETFVYLKLQKQFYNWGTR